MRSTMTDGSKSKFSVRRPSISDFVLKKLPKVKTQIINNKQKQREWSLGELAISNRSKLSRKNVPAGHCLYSLVRCSLLYVMLL